MADLFFAALPIALLVFAMTKPKPVPSTVAFALGSALVYLVRLFWFGSPVNLLNAAVINGLLSALTPIAIVFGAILFFVSMEASGAMDRLRGWLRTLSPHPVAQLMIVGWAFQFLIEGASGFGTPAALAAPVLAGLGFPALRVAMLCLVMNTLSVSFGAVGTPTWFGFGSLPLDPATLRSLAVNTALLQTAAATVIPLMALGLVLPWRKIRVALPFIYLSLGSTMLPMLAVAFFDDEFPTVIGGLTGLTATVLLARHGIGLPPTPAPSSTDGVRPPLLPRPVLGALTPLLAVVAILLATRIPALGLRGWLTAASPHLAIPLGLLGELTISPSLVFQWNQILGEDQDWSHALLYVPSIIPFVLTAGLALWMFHALPTSRRVLGDTGKRIKGPVIALLGALVFVKLLMIGGEQASTMILGNALASAAGGAWIYFAPFLGALGSFFAGSATISNLTFGGIQYAIAQDTGVDPALLLALQSGGAAMGNMICIHNIVAVSAVLGLVNQEGAILKKTIVPVLVYGLVFAIAVLLLR